MKYLFNVLFFACIFISCKNINLPEGPKFKSYTSNRLLASYDRVSGVTSGDQFPSNLVSNNYFCNLSLDSATGRVFVSASNTGIWVYDPRNNSGRTITNSTTTSGSYQVSGDAFPDLSTPSSIAGCSSYHAQRKLLAVGVTKYGVWLLNESTMSANLIPFNAPNPLSGSSGDQLQGGDSSRIFTPKFFGKYLIVSVRQGGIWMYDLDTKVGYEYSATTTAGAGSHAVIGDPINNVTQVGSFYDVDENILVSGSEAGGVTWQWDRNSNNATLINATNTGSGQTYFPNGDSVPSAENYYSKEGFVNGVTVSTTWTHGALVWNKSLNAVKLLNTVTTAPAGINSVIGDPIPRDDAFAMDWDSTTGNTFIGFRGAPGVWVYNTKTNEAELITQDKNASALTEQTNSLVYDKNNHTVYMLNAHATDQASFVKLKLLDTSYVDSPLEVKPLKIINN